MDNSGWLAETIEIKENDTIVFRQSQDVTEVLRSCKEIRELQPGSKKNIGKMKDYHHAMRIPEILIIKLINDGVLTNDYMRDPGQMAMLFEIVKRDHPHFLTTYRKLGPIFKGKS